jgi:cytochrome c-type biogenesis protein CcmE
MKHKAVKIGLTSLVVALSFGGLLYSTLAEGTEYYKHVDEVMGQPAGWYGKKLQLHGYVVPNSILRKPNTMEYWFQVQSNGQIVKASYTGVVPDTFKNDAEVVLKGTLSPEGFHVSPNGVMAKCPSKYEAKPGGAPTSGTP